jgi:hypothetical protein
LWILVAFSSTASRGFAVSGEGNGREGHDEVALLFSLRQMVLRCYFC